MKDLQKRDRIFSNGDRIARIISSNFIKKYRHCEYDDVLQTARVALLSAQINYELDDPQIYKYLYKRLNGALIDAYRREIGSRGKDKRPVMLQMSSLENSIKRKTEKDTYNNIIDVTIKEDKSFRQLELVDFIQNILKNYTSLEAKIICKCMFLGYKQRDCSKELGITETHIGIIMKRFRDDFEKQKRELDVF